MTFEFDPAKSAANQSKHGIDFEAAQKLWRDADAVVLPAADRGEPRQALIGQHDGKLWTAIFTMRGENLRLISVRRARDEERNAYDNQ